MLQTKVSTKISQCIKFCSSLNVEEHEDELSAVQYNKIDYPTPCSKGRQKRVRYYAVENIQSLCSKTLVLIAQFSPSFAGFTKGLEKLFMVMACITSMDQLTVHWCSYSCYATISSSLHSSIYPAFCFDFILNI